MIISQTPFRISLFGGSTDYESFYSKYGSFIIGFAIDKYCYLCVRKTPKIFNYKTKLGYSSIEIVDNHKDIKHLTFQPIIRYGDSVIGTTPLLLRKNNNIFITTINNLFDNNYYEYY